MCDFFGEFRQLFLPWFARVFTKLWFAPDIFPKTTRTFPGVFPLLFPSPCVRFLRIFGPAVPAK